MQDFFRAMVCVLSEVPCPAGPFTRGDYELDAASVAVEFNKLSPPAGPEVVRYRKRFSDLMFRQAVLHRDAQKLIAEVERFAMSLKGDDLIPGDDDCDGYEDEPLDSLPDGELSEGLALIGAVHEKLSAEKERRGGERGSTEIPHG